MVRDMKDVRRRERVDVEVGNVGMRWLNAD